MQFEKYLRATEKVFKFRIKALFPLEDETMSLLERALQKYRPTSVTAPTKMMYQTNPLGFTGVKCGEVYMTDVELTVPVTAAVLEYDLRSILGFAKEDDRLRVFSEFDPVENDPLAHPVEEKKEEPKTALLSSDTYEDTDAKFEDFYGTEYNNKFLAYLKEVEASRKKDKKAGPVNAKNSLKKWEDMPKPGSDLSPEQGKE